MNKVLEDRIVELLSAEVSVKNRIEIEAQYPNRKLDTDAEVTRFCPSPTGFVHIGGIFTAMICQYVARQSGGVYILRIEDTDKKREVEGAKELIVQQLEKFELSPNEGLQLDGSEVGDYGPYLQSERREIYQAYAIDLLRKGRAYPCFATSEELQNAVKDQQSKKMRPGYYGQWALWRDRSDDEIKSALDSGKPFVLRFRSEGDHEKRLSIDDVLKGHLELPENDLDVPLIKSDEHRLPTYHLAHVVDDYLMGATIIMRGEEWLPSTPLHIEIAGALNIPRHRYAHTPVISIIDKSGGGKRKLSKRKDPEADVAYWLKAAYPLKAVKAYLLGLANSNFEDWYRDNPNADLAEFKFSMQKLASSRSPLLDMKNVDDYARDEIARMPQEHFNKEILAWCELHDRKLFDAMINDPEYTKSVLAIERDGDKPRKDVAKWSDAPEQFGYFYDEIFATQEHEKSPLDQKVVKESLSVYMSTYSHRLDKDAWFENMKQAAEKSGFCLDRNDLKANPEKYHGGIADFASLVRIALTGKSRTPDLWTIMQIMGEDRVKNRLET